MLILQLLYALYVTNLEINDAEQEYMNICPRLPFPLIEVTTPPISITMKKWGAS